MVSYPQANGVPVEKWSEASVSPYFKNLSAARKEALAMLVPKDGLILKFHQSLCPECVEAARFDRMTVDAVTYAWHDKVWIAKRCAEHGLNKELSWSDFVMYKKAEAFQDTGVTIENPTVAKKGDITCPTDCGLCAEHESHTALGNIVITNRCDLACWYCFFYAKENDPIYEPDMDQIRMMLTRMRDEKPVGANSIQFTGGEPTIREDLVDIVRTASELGYDHIQLNTNGINLSKNPELAVKLRAAGVSNLYMSFDGVTAQTNPKNFWEAPAAIENCGKAGIGVVLVPTVIGGVNDHELGDIIRFAQGHMKTVRAVNFQPVSLVGRMPDRLRMKQRITIPGAIKRVEAQTDGAIGKEHWFPIPCAKYVTNFIEAIKQAPKYRLSAHFQCGMATYTFLDGEKLVPLPAFFDVKGFFEYLDVLTNDINDSKVKSLKKAWVLGKLVKNLNRFVDDEKKPRDLKFVRMLAGTISGGNYKGMADFHERSLFLGMMHFQDPNNYDIDRVHKCSIHYAVPDGRILPFCTFNVIPELYRDRVQRQFSMPIVEWEKSTGKRIADDRHKRDLSKEEQERITAYYDCFRKTKTREQIESDWGQDAQGDGSFVPLAKLHKA